MTNDVAVNRQDLIRAVEFLKQYMLKLGKSDWPHDEWRLKAVEDVASRLERAAEEEV